MNKLKMVVFILFAYLMGGKVAWASSMCPTVIGKPAYQNYDSLQQEVYIRDDQGHLIVWIWTEKDGWWSNDLTTAKLPIIVGNPNTYKNSWVITRGADGNLYQWFWTEQKGWYVDNLSSVVGGQKISNDPTYYYDANSQHILAQADNGHLVEWWKVWIWDNTNSSWITDGWHLSDLTALTGGQTIDGKPAYYNNGNNQQVFARTPNNDLVEWWWHKNSGWHFNNLSQAVGGQKIAGNPTYFNDNGYQHVFARSNEGHLLEWWWDAKNGWHLEDLTAKTGNVRIAGDPEYFNANDGYQHIFARDENGHLREWWWDAKNGWHLEDLTAKTGGTRIAGDPTYFNKDGVQHVFAIDGQGYLREWWWTAANGWKVENINQHAEPGCAVGPSITAQNQFVFDTLKDHYLWYDKLPASIDPSGYITPEDLLDAVQYKEFDKWSYITSLSDYSKLFEEGAYVGLGYDYAYDADKHLRLRYVHSKSPAARAGLQRGDEILSINGNTVQQIQDQQLWNSVYGENKEGVQVSFEIKKLNGSTQQLVLTKSPIEMDLILTSSILELPNLPKTGYLVFNDFVADANTQLDTHFAWFKSKNISELVLDLRYNGGGLLNIANYLASLIAGEKAAGKIFEKLQHNDKHRNKDYEYTFPSLAPQNSLNLNRVLIITTAATCSASESVINSLKPFVQIVLIGKNTCGKPVGMEPKVFHDKILSAITFKGVNSHGEGDYFGGMPVNCQASDGLLNALGDPAEASLAEALQYMQNNNCSSRRSLLQHDLPEIPKFGFQREIGAY